MLRTSRLLAALCLSAFAFACVSALLLSPVPGQPGAIAAPNAVTRYVALTGTDAGDCSSSASPCRTPQYAVDRAAPGDEIRIAGGAYTDITVRAGITQVVYLTKTVTLRGGYSTSDWNTSNPAANPTVLSALGQGRVAYVTGYITPTLEGLRLTGGNATGLGGYFDPETGREHDGGGALYAAYATPTITNCQMDSSGAEAGGGIALFQSPARIYNSVIVTNQAGYAGGLALGRSDAVVDGNTLAGNTAGYAGGLGVGESAAQITNNTLRANRAISSGGGIALIGNPAATVQGNLIITNTARWGGGLVISGSAASVLSNTITTNYATEVGGGVNLDHCNATLTGNAIQQNTAGQGGGGLYLIASTAIVTRNQVLSNTASKTGGGLYLNESAAHIANNTIAANTIAETSGDEIGGGGVYLRRSNGARLSGNAIFANAAFVYGGGVYLRQSGAELTANFIATNTVDTQNTWNWAGGGGVYLSNSGAATLTGNTIAANRAFGQQDVSGGGVYLNSSDAPLIANRIISNSAQTFSSWSSVYGGGIYVNNSTPTISQNEILSNTALSTGADYGGGIYLPSGASGQIVSNTVAFNESDNGGGLCLWMSAGTVEGNRITSNRATFYGGGVYVNYGANSLQRNTILSNTADIVGGGLALYDAQNNRVVNNVLAANYAAGSNWFCNGGAAIAIRYVGPPLLHNTIVSNTGSAGVCVNGTAALTNTIIAHHVTGVSVNSGGNAILESTLWHSNGTDYSGSVSDTHPLSGDPAFVNPAAGDYHIGAASAALDAGADSGVPYDLDGDARPANAGYDIGADERPGAVLRIVKSAAPIAVNPGGSITYTVIISSVGAANATGVMLTDTLPALARAQSASASQGSCTPGAGWGALVTCQLGALNVGARAVVTLTVETTTTIPASLPARLSNVAHARASETLTMTAQADAWLQDCHARLNDSTTNYATVQAAVDAATQESDIVKVAGTCVGVNTYGGLRQQVYVSKTLTIRGGYTTGDWNTSDPAAHPTALDALGLGRVAYIAGDIEPILEGLTLQNGNAAGLKGYTHPLGGWTEDAGGSVAVVNAGATVTNCQVYSSTATYGGGIFASGGAARIVNNTLAGNNATNGGGLHLANDQAVATHNLIRANTASSGGGVYLNESAAAFSYNTVTTNTASNSGGGVGIDEGTPTVSSNTIVTNSARLGGGLYAVADYAALTGNTIAGNTARDDGGGVYHNNSHGTASGNTLASNTSSGDGGGAYFVYSEAYYGGNAFLNNAAGGDGGGAYVDGDYYGGGPTDFVGNTFIGNTANWGGGGLYLLMGTNTIQNNLMISNTAQDGGGAYLVSMILNSVPQPIQIVGNTVLSNTATRDGGGFLISGPRPFLTGNIVRGNTASNSGGGLYVRNQSYEPFTNTVIADNRAAYGGGLYLAGASPKLLHTTLARNASSDGTAVYLDSNYSGGWNYSHPIFTNTLLAHSDTGIYATSNNSALLNGVLWYSVTLQSDGSGVITITHAITGNPAFAADGYHLTDASAALDQGQAGGVTDDIDDQLRPNGALPDLGADEYWVCTALTEVSLNGPVSGSVSSPLTFSAIYTPSNATPYVRYTWSPEPDAGQSTSVVTYTFATAGERVIQVGVRNCGGSLTATRAVNILIEAPGTPTLSSPPNGTVTTTQALTLRWQKGAGGEPSGYNVELDGATITRTGTTSATVASVGVHTWRVRAYNATGYSNWSAAWTFTVTQAAQTPGVPVLVAPANGAITTTRALTLTWQAGTGATPLGYNVQLDDIIVTTSNAFSPSLLAYGVHTWTVRAYNAAGSSAWAAAWTVETRQHKIYLPIVLRQ